MYSYKYTYRDFDDEFDENGMIIIFLPEDLIEKTLLFLKKFGTIYRKKKYIRGFSIPTFYIYLLILSLIINVVNTPTIYPKKLINL